MSTSASSPVRLELGSMEQPDTFHSPESRACLTVGGGLDVWKGRGQEMMVIRREGKKSKAEERN